MAARRLPPEFPRIETERLVLRELTMDDASAVFANYADPQVVKYIMQPLANVDEARNFVREWLDGYDQDEALVWAITLKPDGTFIGTCGYEEFKWQHRRGEIGYDISPGYWGKGLMSEAVRAIIYYGFSELGLHRIEAHTLLANARSVQLLRRLGFREEGTFRQRTHLGDEFWDQGFFALLRQEYAIVPPKTDRP